MKRMHAGRYRTRWCRWAATLLWALGATTGASCLAAPHAAEPEGVLAVLAANRERGVPNHVTVDVLLVAREDLAARAQKALEREALGALRQWIRTLATHPAGTPASDASTRVDELAALLRVLAGEQPPEALGGRAAAEHALIMKAAGLAPSPLWGSRIDYSQLVPRGYYAEDPELARYFVSARYLGSVLFHARASEATGIPEAVVRTHMEALQEIARRAPEEAAYAALLRPAAAAGGREDDLSLRDVWALGEVADPLALAAALDRRAAETGRRPRVLYGYVDRDRLRPGESAADVLTGVRLLPGVATWDAVVFQRLVNESGSYTGPDATLPFSAARGAGGVTKGYPRADELLVVLGSATAAARLLQSGDTAYAHHADLLRALREENAAPSRGPDATLLATLAAEPDGVQDETARAAWTLMRHRQILHAKQSYTTVSRALRLDPRESASIETAPVVFATLAADARRRAQDGATETVGSWEKFAELADRCRDLAASTAAGKPLDTDAIDFLNGIDRALEALGVALDRPVAVDVHTHPGERLVLQEATTWPRRVEVRCGESICVGAKLGHRELKQALDARLTDADWRARLEAEATEAGGLQTRESSSHE